MTRTLKDRQKRDRVRAAMRKRTLERVELREPTVARFSADGPTSFPSKVMDPETRALIDAALVERGMK